MSIRLLARELDRMSLRLERFDPAHAELVASWVRDDREAYWLAPKTPPPLTAGRIRAWQVPGSEPLQLVRWRQRGPLAYGELNLLNGPRAHFWLGHLIVDPLLRGRGVGQALTQLLLERAFAQHGAARVSLVVFPDNYPAIACYRAAGFEDDGHEEHELPAYARRVTLLRMSVAWSAGRVRGGRPGRTGS